MNELVTFEKGEPRTNTLIVAEGTGNQHKAVIQLVRKYQEDLEEFAPLTFQMAVGNRGGSPTEFAHLNEPQATLIMTYMKNTPIIREFKKRLVRAFYELASGQSIMDNTKRYDFTHLRGTTAPGNLDVRYTLDLTPFVRALPAVEQVRVVEQLTGIKLHGIAEAVEKKAKARGKASVPQAVDPVLVADCLAIIVEGGDFPGLKFFEEDGIKCVQGVTKYINAAIKSVADSLGRPYRATGYQLGTSFGKECAKYLPLGWHREFITTINGTDIYKYSKVKGVTL